MKKIGDKMGLEQQQQRNKVTFENKITTSRRALKSESIQQNTEIFTISIESPSNNQALKSEMIYVKEKC